jgi:chemotaxis protein methyltransferase CheR
MEDRQFRQLLEWSGFSWAGFRRVRKGVIKRLARHMQETGCRNIEDYLKALETDRDMRLHFERLMTVSISHFFRDRVLWEIMKGQILPILAGKACRPVLVWSAGCASGEEAYGFKILWEGLRKSSASVPDLRILATDMNPQYLERAKTGVYPRSSMREVPEAIRSGCFETLAGGKYALRSWVREGIEWQVHDLLSDAPGIGFDLIFLRNNLLTYYSDEVKAPALKKVVDSLAPGGFLIVGSRCLWNSRI